MHTHVCKFAHACMVSWIVYLKQPLLHKIRGAYHEDTPPYSNQLFRIRESRIYISHTISFRDTEFKVMLVPTLFHSFIHAPSTMYCHKTGIVLEEGMYKSCDVTSTKDTSPVTCRLCAKTPNITIGEIFATGKNKGNSVTTRYTRMPVVKLRPIRRVFH